MVTVAVTALVRFFAAWFVCLKGLFCGVVATRPGLCVAVLDRLGLGALVVTMDSSLRFGVEDKSFFADALELWRVACAVVIAGSCKFVQYCISRQHVAFLRSKNFLTQKILFTFTRYSKKYVMCGHKRRLR